MNPIKYASNVLRRMGTITRRQYPSRPERWARKAVYGLVGGFEEEATATLKTLNQSSQNAKLPLNLRKSLYPNSYPNQPAPTFKDTVDSFKTYIDEQNPTLTGLAANPIKGKTADEVTEIMQQQLTNHAARLEQQERVAARARTLTPIALGGIGALLLTPWLYSQLKNNELETNKYRDYTTQVEQGEQNFRLTDDQLLNQRTSK